MSSASPVSCSIFRWRLSRGRAGFSLLEMLVVVALIALLIGLLMVVLSRARDQQTQTRCLANLHQIMDAMVLYAADHDGYGPDEESAYTWDYLLLPYVKDTRLYACPAEDQGLFEGLGSSYAIRDFFAVDIDHPERSFLGKRMLEARPASLIVLFESLDGWHFEGCRNAAALDGSARSYSNDQFHANLESPVTE